MLIGDIRDSARKQLAPRALTAVADGVFLSDVALRRRPRDFRALDSAPVVASFGLGWRSEGAPARRGQRRGPEVSWLRASPAACRLSGLSRRGLKLNRNLKWFLPHR